QVAPDGLAVPADMPGDGRDLPTPFPQSMNLHVFPPCEHGGGGLPSPAVELGRRQPEGSPLPPGGPCDGPQPGRSELGKFSDRVWGDSADPGQSVAWWWKAHTRRSSTGLCAPTRSRRRPSGSTPCTAGPRAEEVLSRDDFASMASWFGDVLTGEDLAVYKDAWRQPRALTGMLNWYRAADAGPPDPERGRPEGNFSCGVPPESLAVPVETLVVWV